VNNHLSRTAVAGSLKQPTWKQAGQACRFLFGLASDGVYMCPACYQTGGSLLLCLSTLTRPEGPFRKASFPKPSGAVYFCCTGLGVASTGRYPASCPVKPGLSSPAAFSKKERTAAIIHPTHFLSS